MKIFLATLVVFALAIVGMAIGVLVSNRRIKGSCGGMAGLKDHDGKSVCEICTNPSPECTGENARSESNK
jgi:hypothetical protein